MQNFPKDSRDEFEKNYATIVLKKFPSYKIFWEKFVGDSKHNTYIILPRNPEYPKGYPEIKKKEFNESQILISKVSYSIFCNLASIEMQLKKYRENSPICNIDTAFWTIESFECAYFHIGNIKIALHNLWTQIKMIYFPKPIQVYNLASYLQSIKKDKNWLLLEDEPYNIRVNLVHLCRHTFHPINNILYLPDYVKLKQYLWAQINTDGWVSAEEKMIEHLNVTYNTCEDLYSSLIPTMEQYLHDVGIKI